MAEYIDRDIAIAKITDMFAEMPDSIGLYFAGRCIGALVNIPAADVVEVKHGKWIEQSDGLYTYYDCSVCGEAFVFIDGEPTDNLYQYCPNCGAKMGGENNV